MKRLGLLLLSQILLVSIASADANFGPDAVPASKAEIQEFFAGKTWIWPCSKCGGFFASDNSFVGVWKDKQKSYVGRGSWRVEDGNLCYKAIWSFKGGADPQKDECWGIKVGPSADKKYKKVLGMKYREKPGYFWIMQDKEVFKEFVKGDRVSKAAKKLESTF